MNHAGPDIAPERALDFLNKALPLADRMTMGGEAAERVARHALALRRETPWGMSIPEDVFLAYVLFPRVNNENPEFYHEIIWNQLKPRLAGLDMAAAVAEVNRWCFEQATYRSTDGRTANALTVMRRGYGRCGEESVLLVSALRSCGIPARQLYVPLWSHCDDNHAWVEAWVDGEWRYMGACEPELSLDSGWFTAAASKAMLVHTRAWGVLPSGERAEAHDGTAWVVNRTAAYARTALLRVRLVEGGRPLPGVFMRVELANMAAFGRISDKTTDADGRFELLCGLGTLHLWMRDGARVLEAAVDTARQTDYEFDFAAAKPFAPGAWEYDQRPPLESRIQPADFPPEAVAAHERWLLQTEAAREARFDKSGDALAVLARGNRGVVEAFLKDARFDPADARALLESLREKDLGDVTGAVLADALEGALPWKDRYPRDVWVAGVLCPRAGDEMLYPVRRWLRENLPALDSAKAVWEYLTDRLADCAMEPAHLYPDPRGVFAHGACAAPVRDALYVALCRTNGIAARLEPSTGEKQYWSDGEYRPLIADKGPTARLTLVNGAGRTLTAGVHFQLAALTEKGFVPLSLYGDALETTLTLSLPAGDYRVMTAFRQIDGSLDARVWDLSLPGGAEERLELTLREDHTAGKLKRAALSPLAALDRAGNAVTLPDALGGRPALVACVAPGQEPTEHFFNELLENRDALARRGIAVRLLVQDWDKAQNAKLEQVLAEISDAQCLAGPDGAALLQWRRALNAGELRLPLAVAVGERGEGLFAFVNYNVGSVVSLIQVIDAR